MSPLIVTSSVLSSRRLNPTSAAPFAQRVTSFSKRLASVPLVIF
jgi:hypothetical protein